jgi:riboflavin biosynthesis pyrimidine reductase
MTAAPARASQSVGGDAPLDVLWDGTQRRDDVRGLGMPPDLARRFGSELLVPLRTDRPAVIANFVSTLDGIVALGRGDLSGGGLISGFFEPDRFVMGLLRAMADVVVVGAGTVRDSGGTHAWTAARVHPRSADATADWRRSMGLPKNPTTIVVTASGDIPLDHAGLTNPEVPVVIATTASGAELLESRPLAPNITVELLGAGPIVGGRDLVDLGSRLGARLMLTEGGPHLLADLVASDLLDELFLTVSPQLVGRAGPGRLGLVEGLSLTPDASRWEDLVSIRRSADHLFLRYRRREPG